jgi:Tol biopolymer transport system component
MSASVSPDGNWAGIGIFERDIENRIWVYDLKGDSFRRLTFEHTNPSTVWSPDGKWLVFSSGRYGENRLVKQLADGSSPAEQLTSSVERRVPGSWSSDGKWIAFTEAGQNSKIGVLSIEGDGRPQYILSSSTSSECCPAFSPNGKWLAYASDESGINNIYIRPYPEPDVKWLISKEEEGGAYPVWSPDGTELFYQSGTKMISVPIEVNDQTIIAGRPMVLFEAQFADHPSSRSRGYDVSPDGNKFLMVLEETAEQQNQINVILNWAEELKRLVPKQQR